jgi:hypothetical protein
MPRVIRAEPYTVLSVDGGWWMVDGGWKKPRRLKSRLYKQSPPARTNLKIGFQI